MIEIREREHNILRLRGERLHGEDAGVAFGARSGIALSEILQHGHPPPADHPLRRFGHDAVHASNLARLHADRIVRNVEVGLFREPVALDLEHQVLRPECLPGADDSGQQLVKHAVPDLAPCLATGKTQGARVFRAKDRTVGVVIENAEFRPPEENDLRLRR